jgi:hypothetical protein
MPFMYRGFVGTGGLTCVNITVGQANKLGCLRLAQGPAVQFA